jgi:hypothetical protein
MRNFIRTPHTAAAEPPPQKLKYFEFLREKIRRNKTITPTIFTPRTPQTFALTAEPHKRRDF